MNATKGDKSMSDKDGVIGLPIWEDLDIDFDRAKRNGEKRAKVLASSNKVNLRRYLQREKQDTMR